VGCCGWVVAGWVVAGSVQQYNRVRTVGSVLGVLPSSTWYRSALAHPCSTPCTYRTEDRARCFVTSQQKRTSKIVPVPYNKYITCTNTIQTLYKHSLCSHHIDPITRLQHYFNTMTSNPTCPDCGRPFKTRKGLSIHRNQCPKRQTQTKQKQQRPYLSGLSSEREGGTSNWQSGDDSPWEDGMFYPKPGTPSAQTNIIETIVSGWQPPADLESADSDSLQEPRSPEPEDPDLTCLPDPSKTQYYQSEAGRSYGTAGGIYRR
jgi:hypothetical protein